MSDRKLFAMVEFNYLGDAVDAHFYHDPKVALESCALSNGNAESAGEPLEFRVFELVEVTG